MAAVSYQRSEQLRGDILTLSSSFTNALSSINDLDNLAIHSIATLRLDNDLTRVKRQFDRVIEETQDFSLTASPFVNLSLL